MTETKQTAHLRARAHAELAPEGEALAEESTMVIRVPWKLSSGDIMRSSAPLGTAVDGGAGALLREVQHLARLIQRAPLRPPHHNFVRAGHLIRRPWHDHGHICLQHYL